MRKNTVKLTEAQLHRVIKESVKKVLREIDENAENEYFFFGGEDHVPSEQEVWRDHGNLNRHDSVQHELGLGKHPGLAAQSRHNSTERAGVRNLKNGEFANGRTAATDFYKKHGRF